MAKHRAGRTAGIFPRIGTRLRADGLAEPRGRLFGEDERRISAAAPAMSVLQAMEILERIADRRAQQVGVSLGFADRIQLLP